MGRKLTAIILAVLVLLGISACNLQAQQASSIEGNLKEINKAMEQFSKLKNGSIEVVGTMKSENNAVESLDNGNTENTSLTTFVLNPNGYDYLEETNSLNKETGEIQCMAIKQVHGTLYQAQPAEPSTNERTICYEWENTGQTSFKPSGVLSMMAVPAKVLSNEKYIKSIIKEKNCSLVKYTLITNGAYAKHMKEDTHSPEENYIVHEHRDIYWVNADGLLIKHENYDEMDYTIDGIADTYIMDITAELTGCNYTKLKELGDELPPMIMFEGELYTQSSALLDINIDALNKIGTIESVVGSVQEPEENNQANRFIKNATVYYGGKNGIIVKYKDYALYEKNH